MSSCVAVFLQPEDCVATLNASNATASELGMDAPTLTIITEATQEGLHEVEDLFDMPLIEASHAEALVAEAKELILVANLRQLRDLQGRS